MALPQVGPYGADPIRGHVHLRTSSHVADGRICAIALEGDSNAVAAPSHPEDEHMAAPATAPRTAGRSALSCISHALVAGRLGTPEFARASKCSVARASTLSRSLERAANRTPARFCHEFVREFRIVGLGVLGKNHVRCLATLPLAHDDEVARIIQIFD
jgi:hypothetical protein